MWWKKHPSGSGGGSSGTRLSKDSSSFKKKRKAVMTATNKGEEKESNKRKIPPLPTATILPLLPKIIIQAVEYLGQFLMQHIFLKYRKLLLISKNHHHHNYYHRHSINTTTVHQTFFLSCCCSMLMYGCILIAAAPQVAANIDCFKCSSLNGDNPSCEDPFHNNFSAATLESPCMGGRKGRNGLFPATACIKMAGVFVDTGETITVRGCALDSGTLNTDTEIIRMSHCGHFYFQDRYVKGCLKSCEDTDGCNPSSRHSPPLSFSSSFLLGIYVVVIPLQTILAVTTASTFTNYQHRRYEFTFSS